MNFKTRTELFRFLLPVLFGLMVSCATPYQKLNKRGGYKEEKINEHVYRVSFQGNTRTKDEVVHRYFLRRCAELTLEKGYQYFIVINTEDKSRAALVVQEGTPRNKAPVTTVAYSSDTGFIPVEHKNIVKHQVEGEIAMFKKGEEPIDAFKAEDVLKSMKK